MMMTRLACVISVVFLVMPIAFGGSVLEVRAMDCDGPGEGYALYSRWDETKGAYLPLNSRFLRNGVDRIGLAPGKYQVRVIYTETLPEQEAVESDIVLEDGEARVLSHHFGKGVVQFQARDNDWCWRADTRVFVYRLNEEAGAYESLRSHALPDRRTCTHVMLAPGRYKAAIQYKETYPEIEYAETEFDVADGQVVSILGLFRHGPMPTRRRHEPLLRKGSGPYLVPDKDLTERLDNTRGQRTTGLRIEDPGLRGSDS